MIFFLKISFYPHGEKIHVTFKQLEPFVLFYNFPTDHECQRSGVALLLTKNCFMWIPLFLKPSPLQVKGWVFESQPRQIQVVKTVKDSSNAKRSEQV